MPERDAWLIYAGAFVRAASVGVTGVTLAIFLHDRGLPIGATGLIIGVGLAGAACATLAVIRSGDRIGRRRSLIALSVVTALGYAALLAAPRLVVLLPAAFLGMVNGMGRDRGAAAVLEQAILPETTSVERRTWVLAWYNLLIDAGPAAGALAGALPGLLAQRWPIGIDAAHEITFGFCACAILASAIAYAALTDRVEVPAPVTSRRPAADRETRRVVHRLALLFGLDSLGGGFLSSALIGYWFFTRHGLSEGHVAVLFFAARVLNALSHVVAAWMARRIGLVNTMVLTHLPSSLFVMAAPAAPTAALAAALFLAREALVEMDVPTRQSYVMAIVPPERRTYASGVTSLTRTVAWAVGPSIAGVAMQQVTPAAPLIIGGALKIGYDLLLYAGFRRIRPPEEKEMK